MKSTHSYSYDNELGVEPDTLSDWHLQSRSNHHMESQSKKSTMGTTDVLKTFDLEDLQEAFRFLVGHGILSAPRMTHFMRQLAQPRMSLATARLFIKVAVTESPTEFLLAVKRLGVPLQRFGFFLVHLTESYAPKFRAYLAANAEVRREATAHYIPERLEKERIEAENKSFGSEE